MSREAGQRVSNMFTDQAQIYVRAGHGGAGKSSFLREKYKPWGGPNGGDGGKGGSVYLLATTKLNSLTNFRHQTDFLAPDGEPGGSKNCFGRDGLDLTIEVPCGTLVVDRKTKQVIVDMLEPEQKFLLAKGGKGGLGNQHFATSRKQAPRYAQPGLPGEEFNLDLELMLIADLGIVGLPNAGKSTLLKVLTKANPKIANYPFTTLSPNLGALIMHKESFIIADIPGLIEGAADGKGLGHDFLRHLERTKYLIHLIDASGFSSDPVESFHTINKELKAYSPKLAKKEQIVVLNKTDVPESADFIKEFKKQTKIRKLIEVSAATGQGIDKLKEKIWELCHKT